MTQEEKQLLFKDLCSRLPYGVVVNVEGDPDFDGCLRPYTSKLSLGLLQKYLGHSFSILPYLRPMSSMTEEERLELSRLTNDKFKFYLYTWEPEIICYEKYNYLEGLKVLDWLNEHHFDFRGLIEKGLAVEAPEDMYKTE